MKNIPFTKIFIGLWILISVAYISYDVYTKFKISVMQTSYTAGQTDTIKALIERAKQACQPFSVYEGEKNKVDLINVECLKNEGGNSKIK
ncbi:MAG: hypothetical protein PHR68_04940 [Candidatus Gracilibacteria bacterium]|nr:hypothetical protein [Candidatus Gracilibacteria bacterium]